MSSIDKYVEGEARACNPNVRVIKVLGRIQGYIGRHKVFDIADRYGYLNDREASIIRESIRAYEEEQRERERREALRIENERLAARKKVKCELDEARRVLEASYREAEELHRKQSSLAPLKSRLSSIRGCDVSAYEERLRTLEEKMKKSGEAIRREYGEKRKELDAIVIREDAGAETYRAQSKQIRACDKLVSAGKLPLGEIERLREELDRLFVLVERINRFESELGRLPAGGEAGAIAEAARREIKQCRIASLEDASALISRLTERLSEVKSAEFRQRAGERAAELSHLDGLLRACEEMREYAVVQTYEAADHRAEIKERAGQVLDAYTELASADYTTCREDRLDSVLRQARAFLLTEENDPDALRQLESMLEECAGYRRDDLLLADAYREYLARVEELTVRGEELDAIEPFDPNAPEAQRDRMNEKLLAQDVVEAVSRTRTSFVLACRVMEEMGYKMLRYDIGAGEGDVDSLACEGIYAIPGCEGVVFQLIVSDCNVTRRLVRVQRPGGYPSSAERVLEVAGIIEETDEIGRFFERYAEIGGGELRITGAIDTGSEGAKEAILQNGAYVIGEENAEADKYYESLTSGASAAERAKWETRLPASEIREKTKAKDVKDAREEESRACQSALAQKRARISHAD